MDIESKESMDDMERQMEEDRQLDAENNSPEDMEDENTPPVQDDQDSNETDDGTVNDAVNDHRLSTEKPKKDIPKEVPIEYLKSPVNGRIFAVNEDLLKRKDLIPCDEDGKKIYDNRKIGRFS
jgi:hypothetical protein